MKIPLAIVGVGNCACTLLQLIAHSKAQNASSIGLKHEVLEGYRINDIDIVAAFDVDQRKVGKDIAHAAFSDPNCTTKYYDVPAMGIDVSAGPLLDGLSEGMLASIPIHPKARTVDENGVADILRSSKAEIVLCYLPVGSQQAAEVYAEAALKANCGFINGTPAILANNPSLLRRFAEKKLPLLGDDVKSQVGSTALHQVLLKALQDRGVQVTDTYQLNIGGNKDFENMRDIGRGKHKKRTKEISLDNVHSHVMAKSVGPSDFVPHLKDHKVGYININGRGILGMQFSIEMCLKVEDSPNSAGILVDAIRTTKSIKDGTNYLNIKEVQFEYFKSPPL